MNNKDEGFSENYYQILCVDQNADERQIKSAFRKKAFMYHPDRNPGNKEAVETFKRITQAYGVLIDPIKRKEYDHYLNKFEARRFDRYAYDDILRDIFANACARDVFEQMVNGGSIRMDEGFLRQILSGGFVFGGLFWGFWGISPIGFHTNEGKIYFGDSHQTLVHLLKTLKDRLKAGLFDTARQVKGFWDSIGGKRHLKDKKPPDFTLMITPKEATLGTTKRIEFRTQDGIRAYKIRIPSGIKDGTNLKIRDQDGQSFYLLITIG